MMLVLHLGLAVRLEFLRYKVFQINMYKYVCMVIYIYIYIYISKYIKNILSIHKTYFKTTFHYNSRFLKKSVSTNSFEYFQSVFKHFS